MILFIYHLFVIEKLTRESPNASGPSKLNKIARVNKKMILENKYKIKMIQVKIHHAVCGIKYMNWK